MLLLKFRHVSYISFLFTLDNYQFREDEKIPLSEEGGAKYEKLSEDTVNNTTRVVKENEIVLTDESIKINYQESKVLLSVMKDNIYNP
jgi:hypothetical protein